MVLHANRKAVREGDGGKDSVTIRGSWRYVGLYPYGQWIRIELSNDTNGTPRDDWRYEPPELDRPVVGPDTPSGITNRKEEK